MKHSQSAITTMVLLAGVVNSFGAVKKSKDITYPILGGFVVLIGLLALAEADEKVAEMFAGAYMITCMLTNGADVFNGITTAITSGKRFDPAPSTPTTTVTGATYSSPTYSAPTAKPSVIRQV